MLLWKLNRGDVSESVCGKLLQMCAALDAGDVAGATQVQVAMTTSDWDEASGFLTALKAVAEDKGDAGLKSEYNHELFYIRLYNRIRFKSKKSASVDRQSHELPKPPSLIF